MEDVHLNQGGVDPVPSDRPMTVCHVSSLSIKTERKSKDDDIAESNLATNTKESEKGSPESNVETMHCEIDIELDPKPEPPDQGKIQYTCSIT